MSSIDNRFPPASHDNWIAAVEKMLRGGTLDSLQRFDEDGLIINALYDGGTAELAGDMATSVRRLSHDPARRTAHGWDVRQPLHILGDVKAMNISFHLWNYRKI